MTDLKERKRERERTRKRKQQGKKYQKNRERYCKEKYTISMWERERKNEQFKERLFVSFSSGAVLHVDQSHIFPPWNGESWGGKVTALAAWHALRPLDSSLNLYSRGFFCTLLNSLKSLFSFSLFPPSSLSYEVHIEYNLLSLSVPLSQSLRFAAM